jgi:hypothetical protein
MRKRLAIFALSTVLLAFGFPPAFGTDDEQVPEAASMRSVLRTQLPRALWVEPENGYLHYGIAFNGGQQALGNQISYIESIFLDQDNEFVLSRVCDDYLDSTCFTDANFPNSITNASVILPVCSEDSGSACLESMSITKNGVTTEGRFLEYVDNSISEARKEQILQQQISCCAKSPNNPPLTVDFPESPVWAADPSRGLPAAKSPSKWRVANVQNKGMTDTYMARATVRLSINPTGEVYFDNLSAEVIPYVETSTGTFYPPTYFNRYNTRFDGADGSFPGSPNYPIASFDNPGDMDPITCAWEEELSTDSEEELPTDSCGIAVQFADGSRTSMTIRIPSQLGGWFHGRVAKADLDLSVINSDLNRLVISAEDVDVPTAGASFPILDPAFAAYTNHFYASNSSGLERIRVREGENPGENNDESDRGLGSWGQWSAEWSVEPFTVMEPLMGDTADGSVNMWQFGTLPSSETSNECFANRNRIQGMISTNAMVYQAGLPSFGSEGFTYQVGGLHKDHLGTTTRGSYSLIMRTEEARCLYELGDSEFTSEVAVTDPTGANKSSQTSVAEDGTWLRIWADEFTFSSPRISLNLAKANRGTSVLPPVIAAPQLTPTVIIPTVKIAIVSKGKSRTSKAILADAGIKLTKGQKATVSIAKASKKFCSVSGSKVKAKKKGTCSYTVTVKNKKGKKVSTKTGSFTIS